MLTDRQTDGRTDRRTKHYNSRSVEMLKRCTNSTAQPHGALIGPNSTAQPHGALIGSNSTAQPHGALIGPNASFRNLPSPCRARSIATLNPSIVTSCGTFVAACVLEKNTVCSPHPRLLVMSNALHTLPLLISLRSCPSPVQTVLLDTLLS